MIHTDGKPTVAMRESDRSLNERALVVRITTTRSKVGRIGEALALAARERLDELDSDRYHDR